MENYIQGIKGNKYPIAKPINQSGLKKEIIELVLNLATPDDDCMLSDFLHALQYVLNKHLKFIEEKHSEELGNKNSYAAFDMENRYNLALLDLIEKIKTDSDLAVAMMGSDAKVAVVAYNSIISKIQGINIDNF